MVPLSSSAQSPSDLAGGHTHRQSSTLVQQLVPQFSSDSSLSDSAHKHQSVISGRFGRGLGRTTFARDQHRLHRPRRPPPHPLPCTFTRAAICPRVVGPLLLSGPKPLLLPHCCCCDKCRCCWQTVGACLFVPLPLFSPSSSPIPIPMHRGPSGTSAHHALAPECRIECLTFSRKMSTSATAHLLHVTHNCHHN